MTIRIQLDTVLRAEKLRPILYALRPVEKRGLRKSGFWGGACLQERAGPSRGNEAQLAMIRPERFRTTRSQEVHSSLMVKCRLLQAGLP
jgi:hypothetical protein